MLDQGKNITVKNKLISGSVNLEYETFDWFGDLVAYGCSNNVLVYDVEKIKVLSSLKGHSGRVNCVKFLDDGKIISVCAKGGVRIWNNDGLRKEGDCQGYSSDEDLWANWTVEAEFELKKKNIVQFSFLQEDENLIYGVFLTTKSDLNFLKISRSDSNSAYGIESIEVLDFGNNLLECSTIVRFNGSIYAMVSSSDFKVHVYEIIEAKGEVKLHLEYLNSLSGHEDKISCLDSVDLSRYQKEGSGEAATFVASGSKDNYVKIWKFVKSLDDSIFLSAMKRNIYRLGNNFLYLESSLIGHADSISSVQWCFKNRDVEADNKKPEDLILLSSSLDFSIQIWEREEKSKIWMNTVRLGQLAGNKNVFFGAKLSANGRKILSYTYGGAYYYWKRGETIRDWESASAVSGHFKEVNDIDWSSDCKFLVSTSNDQTSRVYAQWTQNETWNELSRAQIHGYDIKSIKTRKIDSKDERSFCDLIICGAEEKILRTVEPPAHFINTMNVLNQADLRLYIENKEEEKPFIDQEISKAFGTTMYKTKTSGGYQVLGLMTKAPKADKIDFYTNEKKQAEEKALLDLEIPYDYSLPPNEDYLVKHTLWPELNKMYGHGYEIVSVAVTGNGKRVASSCLSQSEKHSRVLVWDPETYQVTQELKAHEYTVLQIAFGPSDTTLCSVSRDRKIGFFKEIDGKFELTYCETGHKRLIYCVGFSHDEKYLITGSRDKTAKIWEISEDGKLTEKLTTKFKKGVTAVTFANEFMVPGGYHAWVGLENGDIELFLLQEDGSSFQSQGKLGDSFAHSQAVKRIAVGPEGEEGVLVASCADDHTVRILEYLL